MPEPAEREQEPALQFGRGEFPKELDRLNWGAMLMGVLWALAYGVWPWLLALGALQIVGMVVFGFFNNSELANSAIWGLVAHVVSQTVTWTALGLFALSANRLAWKRMGRLIASGRHQPSSLSPSIEKFSKSQKTWLLIGLAVTVVQYANGYQTVMRQWPERQLPSLAGFACAGLVIGAFYLIDKRRADTLVRSS